jgi:hypothetical protein
MDLSSLLLGESFLAIRTENHFQGRMSSKKRFFPNSVESPSTRLRKLSFLATSICLDGEISTKHGKNQKNLESSTTLCFLQPFFHDFRRVSSNLMLLQWHLVTSVALLSCQARVSTKQRRSLDASDFPAAS